jgi:titin
MGCNHVTAAAAAPSLFESLEGRTLFSTYVVTNALDAGAGSLRQAMLDANKHAGVDEIHFAIGVGPRTIAPVTALPTVSDPVVLDATTQPGFAGKPLIELTGRDVETTSSVTGISITAGASVVRGLVINRFSGNGVRLLSEGGNVVCGNYIGTDASGIVAAPNGGQGVFVQSAGNVVGGSVASARNVISGNAKNGVQLYTSAASGNSISGNYVGTDATGRLKLGNGQCGVAIDGAADNLVGGFTAASRNVISANAADGVLVADPGATGNRVWGNYVGTDARGLYKLGNGTYGVEVSQPGNSVGAPMVRARNVISGNAKSGVVLYLASSTGNTVQGNFIGTDASGRRDLGNGGRGVDITNGPADNLVGGASAAARNVISGNDSGGIGVYAAATRNRIEGNFIGTDAYGAAPLPNGGLAAVVVISSAGVANVIGGAGLGAGNVICSDGPALSISAASATLSAGNRIVTGVVFPLL